jgi:oligopeptidase B
MISQQLRCASRRIRDVHARRCQVAINKCSRFFSSNNYRFYREPSAELWQHIERENERTLRSIDLKLRLEIEKDIQNQLPVSAPELGPSGRYFYSSTIESDNTLLYSRSARSQVSEVVEILNINLDKYELKAMSLSVDETCVAYIVCSTQSQLPELWVKDIARNNAWLIPTFGQNLALVEWGPLQENGKHSLFFTATDDWNRPNEVFACAVENGHASHPTQVYYNSDDGYIVDVQRTKGCQWVAISATSKSSNEIYLMKCMTQPPLLVRGRQHGIQYHVDVGTNSDVYLLASADRANHESGLGEQLALFKTSINELPLRSDFGEIMAGNSGEFEISDIDIFRDVIVLYERSFIDGSQRIRVKGSDCDSVVDIPHQLNPCGNMYYDAQAVMFTMESPILQPVTYEYNFQSKTLSSCQPNEHTQNAYIDEYAHLRVLVSGYDGAKIPLSIIHRKDVDPFRREGQVVLVGYGAYGEPVIRGFDPAAASLVDRGVVLAYAHTRGGGDLGRSWSQGGRLYNKRNAVKDYLACAQFLVDSLVEPKRLTAKAFSAGGVVVGASINDSPDIFGSAVFVNAFLDVNTSMHTKMALTEHEYGEWGDPTSDARAAETIAAICPMTNLNGNQKNHPATLLITTLDDKNVPCWHALAYHAKLGGPHLIYTVPQGGHHMHGSGLEIAALINSFIMRPSQL